MQIAQNNVVTVSFIVTDESDQVVGRTDPKRPVETLVNQNYLVPGLEKAIIGRSKGDEFAIKLQPAEAYGEFKQELVQTIDRAMFGDFPVQVGATFEADTSAGPRLVVVKEVTDDTVVVDGNHPLAGKVLNFLVTIEDVREATEEEIAHGHVHHGGRCPSEEHHCCGGHGGHGCGCGGGHSHHHHHDEDHECCGGHGEGHECGCGHHHDDEEHECCGGHGHHHGEGHECGCGHHHEKEEHECCGGHGHHHDDEEHECCGGHGHKHHGEEGHKCGCGGHGHHHHHE